MAKVRALQSCAVTVAGHTPVGLTEGEEFDSTDPLVKACPWLFESTRRSSVEQATAAPGEKRTTRKSAK